jgi:hypothetical protein
MALGKGPRQFGAALAMAAVGAFGAGCDDQSSNDGQALKPDVGMGRGIENPDAIAPAELEKDASPEWKEDAAEEEPETDAGIGDAGGPDDSDQGLELDSGEQPDAEAEPAAQITGTLKVTRCELENAGMPVIQSPGGRSSQRVDMPIVADRAENGATTPVETACFKIEAVHIQQEGVAPEDIQLEVRGASVNLNGQYFDLMTSISWGGDVFSPHTPRRRGTSIQPSLGALHFSGVAEGEEPDSLIVRVEHSLGHERENREDPDGPGVIDDHEDDHFSEAYLEIEAGDGIEVDCYHARNPEGEHPFDQLDIDHCRAPGTSFNNRGRYNLYTQHIAGDPDFIQAIARGPLDPHVTVGDWSLFPRVGSFGTLTNFDVSCIDPDRESLPLNGQAIITVRDGDHIQVEEVAAGAMRNGSISLPEPIEIHPGDVLDIELIASDLDLEENETTVFQCGPTGEGSIAVTDGAINSYSDEGDEDLPFDQVDNRWNRVSTDVELPPDVPANRIECYTTGDRQPQRWDWGNGDYLYDENTDELFVWDENNIEVRELLSVDETEIFGWGCYNHGNETFNVHRVAFQLTPEDFDAMAEFRFDLFADGELVHREGFNIQAMNNGNLIDLVIEFEEAIEVMGSIEMKIATAVGAEHFPQSLQARPYFFIERPKIGARISDIDVTALDPDGVREEVEAFIHTVVSSGEDEFGNQEWSYDDAVLGDPNAAEIRAAEVEFTENPWSIISLQNNEALPLIVDIDDQEVLDNGVKVWEGVVQNFFDGGKPTRLSFGHTGGKVELGNTIVEVRIGNQIIIVPPHLWDENGFEVMIDPNGDVFFNNGHAIHTNDPEEAVSRTRIQVFLRANLEGFNEAFQVSLKTIEGLAGTGQVPLEFGGGINGMGNGLVDHPSEDDPDTWLAWRPIALIVN